MVCHQCAFQNHSDHAKKIERVTSRDLEGFCERALHRLQERKHKLQDLIDAVNVLQQKEKSYQSDQFIQIFKDVQDQLLPHLSKAEKLEVNLVMKANAIVSEDFSSDTIEAFNLEGDHEALMKQWIAGEEDAGKLKFELIYKATRDTFSSVVMHQKINDQGPTISLVKSEFGKVFGGYCKIDWKDDGAWKSDPDAFIFSVDKKTKHEQYQNKE